MTRPNRPAGDFFVNQLLNTKSLATLGARETIDGAQTINCQTQQVVGGVGGGTTAFAINNTTTINQVGGVAAGATTMTVTNASAAGITAGSVIVTSGPTLGVPTPEVLWVTDVTSNVVTFYPPITASTGNWPNGTTISVLPAIQSECTTAQSPDGLDLGTTVVGSALGTITWTSGTPVGGSLYVCAMRTGFQYSGFPFASQISAGLVDPCPPGPGLTIMGTNYPGNMAAGWTSYPVSPIGGSSLITLESPTPWFTQTLSSASSVGATTLSIPAAVTFNGITVPSYEVMIGDATEPAELQFVTQNTSTSVYTGNPPPQVAHASGSQYDSPTSSGQSSWTFFPMYHVGNVATTVTFSSVSMTIDPR